MHIASAIHEWCGNNGIDHEVTNLAPYLIELMQSLEVVVHNMPDTWSNLGMAGMRLGGTGTTSINFTQSPGEHMLLRSAISITGDAFCVTKCLKGLQIGNIEVPIDNLHAELGKLRDFRNFLTHLDDRFKDRKKHGIAGKTTTGCGIEYLDSASDCFHLMLVGNTVHYSDYKIAKEADVGKPAFIDILIATKKLIDVFNKPPDIANFLARLQAPPSP
ncbi:hypothetical protein ACXR0M_10455 [Pseudomonas sp. Eth.TT006]